MKRGCVYAVGAGLAIGAVVAGIFCCACGLMGSLAEEPSAGTATPYPGERLGTPRPSPTPRPAIHYMFCDGCGDPRTTEPFELRDGEVEFTWDQGGTGVFGMRLEDVAIGDSRIVVAPIAGHMAGWETVHVAADSYRLRIWCYATDLCVYVDQ